MFAARPIKFGEPSTDHDLAVVLDRDGCDKTIRSCTKVDRWI